MIDTNVYLSRWPFRRLPADEPGQMVSTLRAHGVTQAWAGSFDALLHKDITAVNARLAADCRAYGDGLLTPIGTVNPKLPDWQSDLARCHQEHRMPAIRLHPDYHGYELADPLLARLLESAAERGLLVQLACAMEDERTQHPLLRVPAVDPAPLAALVRRLPKLRLQILNWRGILARDTARRLGEAGRVYFEFAMLEQPGALERLIEAVPAGRVVFGSYFPFYVFESAGMKLRESGIGEDQRRAITEANARRLLTA